MDRCCPFCLCLEALSAAADEVPARVLLPVVLVVDLPALVLTPAGPDCGKGDDPAPTLLEMERSAIISKESTSQSRSFCHLRTGSKTIRKQLAQVLPEQETRDHTAADLVHNDGVTANRPPQTHDWWPLIHWCRLSAQKNPSRYFAAEEAQNSNPCSKWPPTTPSGCPGRWNGGSGGSKNSLGSLIALLRLRASSDGNNNNHKNTMPSARLVNQLPTAADKRLGNATQLHLSPGKTQAYRFLPE